MLKKRSIMKWTSFAAAALLFGACGSDPKNYSEDDDSKFRALFPEGDVDISDKWLAFSAYLGVSNLQSESDADLIANIGQRPRLYDYLSPIPPGEGETTTQKLYDGKSEEQQAYEEARFNLAFATKLATSAAKSQCAEVVGATPAFTGYFKTADGSAYDPNGSIINFHYLRYKLSGDENARTAIFVKPTITDTAADLPLVMYSHAVTGGIKYSEIASLLGGLQAKAFIAAPSFPGEGVYCEDVADGSGEGGDGRTAVDCKDYTDGVVAAPIGEVSGSTIYDQDADELHGLYSCLEKARADGGSVAKLAHGSFEDTEETVDLFTVGLFNGSAIVGSQTVATSNTAGFGEQIYTVLAGADRGAFTNQVAAGKAGIYLQASTYGLTLPENFRHLRPQGILSLGSQSSFSTGINLIALELMFKDSLANHSFNLIPTFKELGTLFNGYASELKVDDLAGFNPDAETQAESVQAAFDVLASAAAEVAIRDLTFMGQQIAVSVRDWKSGVRAKGDVVWLHGTKDKLASFTQSAINSGTMAAVDDAYSGQDIPTFPGGINHFVYGFQPTADYLDADGELKGALDLNHVSDLSFLTGQLVGLSDNHYALVEGTASAAGDVQTDISSFFVPPISAVTGKGAAATLYPLLDSANRTPGDDATKATTPVEVTPPQVAGSWILYHVGKAALGG